MAAQRKAKPQRKAAPPRVGLFVEGRRQPTPGERDDLLELWRYQCGRVSHFPPEQLDVYGFSKQQIVIMDPAHAAIPIAGKISLDVEIEQKFKARPFQYLLIAFDAIPANQAIQLNRDEQSPCLRAEKNFLLERLAKSTILPSQFCAAAARLLAHYQKNRSEPRAPKRPPIGAVELIYMDPTFESLVLQDERAIRSLFELKKTPSAWPALPPEGERPDFVLRKIVNAHRICGPKHLRVPYDAAKHAWAQEILRNAPANSPIWQHPIAVRLQKVLS